MPLLVVIGGPNGSGKTTLTKYLIDRARIKSPVINPDDIAFSEFGDYSFHVKAARIALKRRKQAIDTKTDIVFETTFSRNSEISDVQAAKSAGYQTIIVLCYFVIRAGQCDQG